MQTQIYEVNGTDGNSLDPLGTTICTLEFPKKFKQQFIACKHLIWPLRFMVTSPTNQIATPYRHTFWVTLPHFLSHFATLFESYCHTYNLHYFTLPLMILAFQVYSFLSQQLISNIYQLHKRTDKLYLGQYRYAKLTLSHY